MHRIGVFDSGIGGLTVLRQLRRAFPQLDMVYLGDTARVPYGGRSVETITHYAEDDVRFLLRKDVEAIVIACGTVSSNSLDALREKFDLPIYGVIESAARLAADVTKTCSVGVIGTQATVKAMTPRDLRDVKANIILANTYHLYLRPGHELVREAGGLHTFMHWDRPILTDSGGFQVFSLAKLRKITEEGVTFASHLDGHRIFMGPEESMQIQANLGSTIAMAFDECVENPAQHAYSKDSCERTTRWLKRCKAEMARLKHEEISVNPDQLLFGINQGCTFADLRVEHMKQIAELELDGYAIGGLAVGEPAEVMYEMISQVEPHMPKDKIRYLMGVGTPGNIIEAVARGVDLFDCVMPSRNARHGHLNTWSGIINIKNAKYERDERPIDPACGCPVCRNYSRAYVRHLLKADEMLGMRLTVMHNLWFYNHLMERIRDELDAGTFTAFHDKYVKILDTRI